MCEVTKSDIVRMLQSQIIDWVRERVDIKPPEDIYTERKAALRARFDEALQLSYQADASPEERKIQGDQLIQYGVEIGALDREYEAAAEDEQAAYEQRLGEQGLALFNELFEAAGPLLEVARQGRIWQASWGVPAARLPSSQNSSSNSDETNQLHKDISPSGQPPPEHDTSTNSFRFDRVVPDLPATHPPSQAKRRAKDAPAATAEKRPRTGEEPEKTIDFEEVFQGGNAPIKYTIAQFPSLTGDWYILRCGQHQLNFSSRNPIWGAGKHLGGQAHNMKRDNKLAIETLGVRVRGCSKALAEQNNAAVRQAEKNGYTQPFRSRRERRSRLQEPASADDDSTEGLNTSRLERSTKIDYPRVRNSTRGFKGVMAPIPGEPYTAYYQISRKFMAVLLLPLGDFAQVGLEGNMQRTGLLEEIPGCFTYNEGTKEITGWQRGYQDGGPLVSRRAFPVIYIDGPTFPDKSPYAWVDGKDLGPFNTESYEPLYAKMVLELLRTRVGEAPANVNLFPVGSEGTETLEPQNGEQPALGSEAKKRIAANNRPKSGKVEGHGNPLEGTRKNL
ncbi:Fc.00g027220.m01.CDS01 [Cosmosporella sp. VM-42]